MLFLIVTIVTYIGFKTAFSYMKVSLLCIVCENEVMYCLLRIVDVGLGRTG